MTTDIFIVSCAKHFGWLKYCLRSIERFASGFRQVLIMIPDGDLPAFTASFGEFATNIGVPLRVKTFADWPDKGFLRHEDIIVQSDTFSDADFFCHFDSDCLFVEPVTPEDYFIDGKPVLMFASYHWLVTTQQANLGMWQAAVERAIGGPVVNEFMRRHPAVHRRDLYAKARQCIEDHAGQICADYIRSCENGFPQTFCEFNTLGEVAWRNLHDHYRFWNQETEGFIKPHKVVQFWSHASPDVPQSPIYKDHPFPCTPASLLAAL